MAIVSTTLTVPEPHMQALVGPYDANLTTLSSLLDADLHVRGDILTITSQDDNPGAVAFAERVITSLLDSIATGLHPTTEIITRTVDLLTTTPNSSPADVFSTPIVNTRGRTVRPRTAGQKLYADSIAQHTIVFGIGPAGTGKSYLAVAMAVQALRAKQVSRIILTRPAVEAGENLGFLPGTLTDKIDPYLRPLYDALRDLMDAEHVKRLMDTGVIEVAPLAYMRGRTLNDAFIILDEAQNTTPEQMKMFLTRLGERSTMVVTGDITQVDLPRGKTSGLTTAVRILTGCDPDIDVVTLTSDDVVRHPLVTAIVNAYDKSDRTATSQKGTA